MCTDYEYRQYTGLVGSIIELAEARKKLTSLMLAEIGNQQCLAVSMERLFQAAVLTYDEITAFRLLSRAVAKRNSKKTKIGAIDGWTDHEVLIYHMTNRPTDRKMEKRLEKTRREELADGGASRTGRRHSVWTI